MKNLLWVLVIGLVLSLGVSGCSKTPPEEPFESAWEVTFIGSGGEKVFAIETLKEMTAVTIEAEKKEVTNSYTGIRLSVLLAEAGITDFEELVLEAADGYQWTITREEALSQNSILAYAIDGEDLSDDKSAPLMFVSTATSARAWVGQLKTVRVGE